MLGGAAAASFLVVALTKATPANSTVYPKAGTNIQPVGGGGSCTFEYKLHGVTPIMASGSCAISAADLGTGSATDEAVRDYARDLGFPCPDDDAGHVLAHHLGGCGKCPTNIVPQCPHLNRGAWGAFEKDIYDCTGRGETILSWKFQYGSSPPGPPSPTPTKCCFFSDPSCSAGQTCCSGRGVSYSTAANCKRYGAAHGCVWHGDTHACIVGAAAAAAAANETTTAAAVAPRSIAKCADGGCRPVSIVYSASYPSGHCANVSHNFSNPCMPTGS